MDPIITRLLSFIAYNKVVLIVIRSVDWIVINGLQHVLKLDCPFAIILHGFCSYTYCWYGESEREEN